MTGFIAGAACAVVVGLIVLWVQHNPEAAKAVVARIAALFRRN